VSDEKTDVVEPAAPVETPAAEVPAEAPKPKRKPKATPVLTVKPSSEAATQQPESAPEAEKEPLPLAFATRALLVFVKAHRTAGDADLEAAVADVEASLAAQA
jgi:hypothetical protein